MAIMDFAIFLLIAFTAEFAVYKYISSYGKFSVSSEEKTNISNHVQRILKMKPEEMIGIERSIRDELSMQCKHKPIRQMLLFTWGLSEEISKRTAEKFGTRLSQRSKDILDSHLVSFKDGYTRGKKLETYDSVADMFRHLVSRNCGKPENIDRAKLAHELRASARSLAEGNSSFLLSTLSRYVQRSFEESDILLFINALNDLIYRVRARLREGPTYYDLLINISRDIEYASKAIEKSESLLLYEVYERIFKKAYKRVERVDRFQKN